MATAQMQAASTTTAPVRTADRTGFRWVILLMACLLHMVNFADRANIGVAIPALRSEFHISNFQLGQMASYFFLGYFIVQIPAGWAVAKLGVRGFITGTILAFSVLTGLIGTAVSAIMIMVFRVALGIAEAPTVVATNSCVKQWFPAKERGTALGWLTGMTTLSVGITPLVAAWILNGWGWRYIFYYFAMPGVILSIVWYFIMRRNPEDSPYPNAAEREYIRTAVPTRAKKVAAVGALGWFDTFLRAKKVPALETNGRIFLSRNIWGIALTYFLIQIIFYGIATWVPSFLLNARGFSIMKMGWVATTPWIGGAVGNLAGGWISDNWFLGRRKPMMLIAGFGTVFGMWAIIHATTPVSLGITMFITGMLANCAWPSYFAFPMGVTTAKTYPVAISVMIMGGNVGAFVSPMTGGWLLDHFKTFDAIFIFMGAAALLSALTALSLLDEPVNV